MAYIRKISIMAIVLGAVILSSAAAKADDGPRYRYSNSIDKTINKDWSITLYSEIDTDKDRGHDLNAMDQELSLVYSGLATWLDVGPGVGYFDGKNNGHWEYTTYPYGFITLKKTFLGLSFNDRNRFDADLPHHAENAFVYRNALTIATAKKWTRFEIQPFVSDEIFYNSLAKYMSDNQAFAGINFKITKNIGGSLSFMMDSSHSKDANDIAHWKKTPMVIFSTSVNF